MWVLGRCGAGKKCHLQVRHFLKILPAFVFSYSLLFPEQSHLPPRFQLSPLNWWLPNLLSRCLPWAPPFIFIHSFSEHLLGSYYMPGAEDSKTDNSCPRRSPASSPSPLTCSQGLHIQLTQISSSCCVCCHTDQSFFPPISFALLLRLLRGVSHP